MQWDPQSNPNFDRSHIVAALCYFLHLIGVFVQERCSPVCAEYDMAGWTFLLIKRMIDHVIEARSKRMPLDWADGTTMLRDHSAGIGFLSHFTFPVPRSSCLELHLRHYPTFNRSDAWLQHRDLSLSGPVFK